MEIQEAKFICSYGGQIKKIRGCNNLIYVGGINKILYVDRRIDFTGMDAQICGLFDLACNSHNFKFLLPDNNDILVSVTNDTDLHQMMLEFDQIYRDSPITARIRLFLFPNPNPNQPLDSVKPISNGLSSKHGEYDVFISFRGEERLSKFTSSLHEALIRNQIKTFDDDALHKGDCISASLLRAIEDSSVFVVVFSKNYATSSWCLYELLKIMECGRKVIPVFYGVDRSHVRKQLGCFIEKGVSHLQHDMNKVQKWKEALTEAADLEGWDSSSCRDDLELVEKIVKDVLRKLENLCLPKDVKSVVGINKNLEKLEKLLSSVPDEQIAIIGICGMGGLGKTTLARIVYQKLSYHYEGSCFLGRVQERLKKYGQGLYELRNQLHSELLQEKDRQDSMGDTTSAKCRLCRQRNFIVLDDVGSSKQLEYLIGDLQCYGAGSRIIVITRDKSVLEKRVEKIYEMEVLGFQDSLALFSLNAFNQNYPKMGYQELSWKAVTYCKGVPLSLKVLGSFLHSKSETEWDSALQKLEKNPNAAIQNMLRLSYNGLDYQQNHIVLDIATSSMGEQKEQRVDVLISSLLDQALIVIYDHFMLLRDFNKNCGGESFVRILSRFPKIIAICGVFMILVTFWKTARNSFN